MDECDLAQEREVIFRDAAIKAVTVRPALPLTGACYNCGEMRATLFCDVDCEKDYSARMAASARNGFM